MPLWSVSLIQLDKLVISAVGKTHFADSLCKQYVVGEAYTDNAAIEFYLLDFVGGSPTRTSVIDLSASGPPFVVLWDSTEKQEDLILLATVCGDGRALILLVNCRTLVADNLTYQIAAFPHVNLVVTGVPFTMITSFCWGQTTPEGHRTVLTGLSDGTVVVWEIRRRESSLEAYQLARLYDSTVDRSTACTAAVLSVSVCPYNSALFATGGYDGVLKIWHIEEHHRPVYARKHHVLGWIYHVCWDPLGHGLFFSGSDQSTVNWDPLWSTMPSRYQRFHLYSHPLKHSCVCAFQVRLLPGAEDREHRCVLVSAATDGSVRSAIFHEDSAVDNGEIYQHYSVADRKKETAVDAVVFVTESRAQTVPPKSVRDGAVGSLPDPEIALTTIDALVCEDEEGGNRVLMVFGGQDGVLRCVLSTAVD